ncbi:MAG: hypothetical protein JWO82_2363, partial [Akkermansiaceae bacterium]|nr:hypothetical protein [Akkermansiaceae bacterium]
VWGNLVKVNSRAGRAFADQAEGAGLRTQEKALKSARSDLMAEQENVKAFQAGRGDSFTERLFAPPKRTAGEVDADYQLRISGLNQQVNENQAGRDALNFSHDMQQWQERYNPTKTISKGFIGSNIESGLYQVPNVIGYGLVSHIPIAGPGMLYATSEGQAYDDFRDKLKEMGVPEEKAQDIAGRLSPVAGGIVALSEFFGAKAIKGTFPVFDKALTALTDKIQNRALRFISRSVAISGEEFAIERGQDFVNPLVQSAAASIDQTIPGVKKEDVLDGFWAQNIQTAAAIIPLAMFGAAGGISQDRRTKVWAAATDTQLKALGVPEANLPAVREGLAKGLTSGGEAIDHAMQDLNPHSPEARAAAEELIRQKEAVQEAQSAGLVPKFVVTSEGISVVDPETGNTIGTAANQQEAMELASEHSSAVAGASDDRVAYMASMLQAAQETTDANTTTTVAPGEVRTTAQQADKSFADEGRVAAQVAAEEVMAGGTGEISRAVFGTSTTEFQEKLRKTQIEILGGASALTVVHEKTHADFKEALRTGRLTEQEATQYLRAVDQVFQGKTTRDGQPLRFLPDGEISSAVLDEAVSKFMEAEAVRTRKGASAPGKTISAPVLTNNLKAAVRLLAPEAARKFTAFRNALMKYFGVAFSRAMTIKEAMKDGKLDAAAHEKFVSKLLGLENQDAHQAAAVAKASEIATGEPASLSLGPAEQADILAGDIAKMITKPEEKARYFERMLTALGKLKRTIANDGVLYGSEDFTGSEHEGEIQKLDERRETTTQAHDDRLAEIEQKTEASKQEERAKLLEKFGPQDGKTREEKKAFNEAVRQAEAKIEKQGKLDVSRSEKVRDKSLSSIDLREKDFATKAALSDTRKTILNALATFDGLLATLPTDLRGKVGGYTQLASLKTDESRLKYLQDRVGKIEVVIESHLRKEYGGMLTKLFERATLTKGGPGEKPKGKATAEAQSVLDLAKKAVKWSAVKTDEEATKFEAAAALGQSKAETPPEEILLNQTKAEVIRLVGDWNRRFSDPAEDGTRTKISDGADAARRAAAVKTLENLWNEGYA